MTQPLTERLRELLAKCTPGSWTVENHIFVKAGNGYTVAAVRTPSGSVGRMGEAYKANVELTALAPDMAQRIIALEEAQAELVEALKHIVGASNEAPKNGPFDQIDNDGEYYQSADLDAGLTKARALVAKLGSSQ